MNEPRIRKVDVGLIVQLITIGGAIWMMFSKPSKWDQACVDISEIKPKVERHETQLAVTISQYSEIIRRLERIERNGTLP